MNILDEIIQHTRRTIEQRKRTYPFKKLSLQAENLIENVEPKRFRNALETAQIQVIAEAKRASPSRGIICKKFHPVEIAKDFQKGGAAALSILTEEKYFKGSLKYLSDISKITDLPLLRKDFIVDEYQIFEAAANFASAVLLIVAALDDRDLQLLLKMTRRLKMDALVEVHNQDDLQRALDCGAEIIGINNRDLKTFQTSLHTSLELIQNIPSEKVKVSESGIKTREDVLRLQAAGFDAVLVGEMLMRQPDRVGFLKELRGVACG